MSANKKRSADALGDQEDLLEKIQRLEEETQKLEREVVELKTKLAGNEDEESDDDDSDEDDASVCDGSPWSVKYNLLKKFKAQNGHCNVPRRNEDLGRWVNNMRLVYKNKKLAKERIEKLEKLGFLWRKDQKPPPSWDDYFEELIKYRETFGDCNIPVDPNPDLQTDLAKWVVKQRKQGKKLRKQKPSEMTMDQFKKLMPGSNGSTGRLVVPKIKGHLAQKK